MNKEVKIYTDKKEYNKDRNKRLKFLQKTYSWYKHIEESMDYWDKHNKLKSDKQ